MSCRICSARRDIPFNQKQHSWSSKVIHDFNIMESISMDLKVMPTSFCGYYYLLVMCCNHSRFVITDTLKTMQESMRSGRVSKLICASGTKRFIVDTIVTFINHERDIVGLCCILASITISLLFITSILL